MTVKTETCASCASLAGSADAILSQCESFVRSLDDSAYTGKSTSLSGGTVGKHLRHTLDHFAAALAALDHAGVIDYDHRDRDVPMESDRQHALRAIAALRDRLGRAAAEPAETPVSIRVMISGAGDEAELRSTFGRELAFATHHAVHHQAMMKVIAAEFGAILGADFGTAPSTIKFNTTRGS
jgi:uncharacterized damage-inducible protein DinB